MSNPDERREAAIEAAAEANYESHRPAMQHLNSHVHIELWDELPEDERDIERSHLRIAVAAYDAARSGEHWQKRCLNCGHSSDDHRLDDASNGDPTDPETLFRCVVEGCDCAAFVEPQDAAADQAAQNVRAARSGEAKGDEWLRWLLDRAEKYIAAHAPTEDLQHEIRAALAGHPEPRQDQPVDRVSGEQAAELDRLHERGWTGDPETGEREARGGFAIQHAIQRAVYAAVHHERRCGMEKHPALLAGRVVDILAGRTPVDAEDEPPSDAFAQPDNVPAEPLQETGEREAMQCAEAAMEHAENPLSPLPLFEAGWRSHEAFLRGGGSDGD